MKGMIVMLNKQAINKIPFNPFNDNDIELFSYLTQNKNLLYIYIKIITIAIKHKGFLEYGYGYPYTVKELSELCECSSKDIKELLYFLKSKDLVMYLCDTIYFKDFLKHR